MTEMSNNHDRFFREVFSRPNWAQQFLAKYLPKPVARTLDLTTLHLRSGSFVDQNLREHFSDLLYQAQLNNGLTGYVYILFEHKSYPERLIAFQLLPETAESP